MFNDVDEREARNVCVIGTAARDALFGSPEQVGRQIIPVGEFVNINNQRFRVIGMYAHNESELDRKARELAKDKGPEPAETGPARRQGQGSGAQPECCRDCVRGQDNSIHIPLKTLKLRFRSATGLDGASDERLASISFKVKNYEQMDQALQQVKNVMMRTHQGITVSAATQRQSAPRLGAGAAEGRRGHPPFACNTVDPGHSRLDARRVEVFALDPLEVDLPYVRRLIVVRKTSSTAAMPDVETTSSYLSSRLPGPAADFARAIRGPWGGSEIRNHWVRDALWAEDRTRSKHWHLNANLAGLRAGLIALRAQTAAHLRGPQLFERCAHQPAFPLRLLTQPCST